MIFDIAYHLHSFSGLAVRGSSLQARIDKLAVKVSTFYIIHYIVDLPPLFIFQLFLGDPAGLQCWGGDSSRDPTEESFPLHSELWPTGEWSFVLKENPQERILQSIPQKIQWKAIDGFAIYCLGLIIRQNSFTLSSPRSYPEKQCQSLCWNSTSPVTSRLPWTNSILIGEIILSPQLCLHHHRHSGRMAKMDWSFTLMQITSSTCGAQKCCSPLRRPAPREEGWGKSERGLSLLTNCSSITCHRVIFMLENWSLWM